MIKIALPLPKIGNSNNYTNKQLCREKCLCVEMNSLEIIVLQLTENKKIYHQLQVLWSSGCTKEQVDWVSPCVQCGNRIHGSSCKSERDILRFLVVLWHLFFQELWEISFPSVLTCQ